MVIPALFLWLPSFLWEKAHSAVSKCLAIEKKPPHWENKERPRFEEKGAAHRFGIPNVVTHFQKTNWCKRTAFDNRRTSRKFVHKYMTAKLPLTATVFQISTDNPGLCSRTAAHSSCFFLVQVTYPSIRDIWIAVTSRSSFNSTASSPHCARAAGFYNSATSKTKKISHNFTSATNSHQCANFTNSIACCAMSGAYP